VTPCEELDYKINDWFLSTAGTVAVLVRDDGTVVPEFLAITSSGNKIVMYLRMDTLKKLKVIVLNKRPL